MAWWWRRSRPAQQQPTDLISISDPALAEYFRVGNQNYSGVPVGEGTALGISAFWRAVSIISGTIAMLPMRTIREVDGAITHVGSVFDDPGAVIGMTPFEWKQTVILHQLLHGAAPLAHVYNVAGALAGLVPLHPLSVMVDPPPRRRDGGLEAPYQRTFSAILQTGERVTFTERTMTYCPALSLDGRVGLSLIGAARNSLGIAVAGDRAAGRMFANGALISGLVTPEEGERVEPDDVKTIKADLDATVGGWENAGGLALVNRRLKLSPWTMSNKDAQFLESRAFQIEEIARWTGVPPHLLMQTEKQTSWGTGVAEQNRGLSRYNLAHWTTRLQQQLSRRLAAPRSVIFDYTEWEKPDPQQQTTMLVQQVRAGIITRNEARAALGMAPMAGGDQLETAAEPTRQESIEEAATV
jgi:HK97 family phage portal protein